MNGKIDLIIFDCDGVLIDSEGLSVKTLVRALNQEEVPVTIKFVFDHFIGLSFAALADIIQEKFQMTLAADFELKYWTMLKGVFKQELCATKGVISVLQQLDVPKCVATSSSPERARFSLEHTKLIGWFEGKVFTASEVDKGKPAPDLFLHAAKRCNVHPRHCLVIEDSIVGLQAASAANMNVIRYVGGSHLKDLSHNSSEFDKAFRSLHKWDYFFEEFPMLKPAN